MGHAGESCNVVLDAQNHQQFIATAADFKNLALNFFDRPNALQSYNQYSRITK